MPTLTGSISGLRQPARSTSMPSARLANVTGGLGEQPGRQPQRAGRSPQRSVSMPLRSRPRRTAQRSLFAQAVTGSTIDATSSTLSIFLDTVGPRVSSVTFGASGSSVFLRTPPGSHVRRRRPWTSRSPTPRRRRRTSATFAAVNSTLAQTLANYTLTGVNGGNIPISSVNYTETCPAALGTTLVQLNFAARCPTIRIP